MSKSGLVATALLITLLLVSAPAVLLAQASEDPVAEPAVDQPLEPVQIQVQPPQDELMFLADQPVDTAAAPPVEDQPLDQPVEEQTDPAGQQDQLFSEPQAPAQVQVESRTIGGSDMVRIPRGPLPDPHQRAESDEEIAWTEGFWIDRTEVTNRQFAEFLSADASNHKYFDERMWITENENGTFTPDVGFEHHPVNFVDWFGAYAFATWKGGSLPTEEEWILASMGAFNNENLVVLYPWGEEPPPSVESNLLEKNRIGSPSSVGSYPTSQSPTGLFDMAGNVSEWTLTSFEAKDPDDDPYEREEPKVGAPGPEVPPSLRFVIKGGSFLDPPENTQLNRRATRLPYSRYQYVGFRTVRREGQVK